jgi:hypothetical protein
MSIGLFCVSVTRRCRLMTRLFNRDLFPPVIICIFISMKLKPKTYTQRCISYSSLFTLQNYSCLLNRDSEKLKIKNIKKYLILVIVKMKQKLRFTFLEAIVSFFCFLFSLEYKHGRVYLKDNQFCKQEERIVDKNKMNKFTLNKYRTRIECTQTL